MFHFIFCYDFEIIYFNSTFKPHILHIADTKLENVMKKFVQGAVLPFTLFASSLLILGCDSTAQNSAEKDINESQTVSVSNDDSASEQQTAKPEIELKIWECFLHCT